MHAHVISDSAGEKALGSILRVSKHASSGEKAVTTITSLRGWVMAVRVLWGDPSDPVLAPLSRKKAKAGPLDERGWDATSDDDVRPELALFLRKVSCFLLAVCDHVAEGTGVSRFIPGSLRHITTRGVRDALPRQWRVGSQPSHCASHPDL